MNQQYAKEVNDNASEADRMIAELAQGNPAPSQEATPENQPIVQPEKQEKVETDNTDYKQRFLVMQGKYNAEVPRYQNEIGQLKGQLANNQKADTDQQAKPANVSEAMSQLTEEWGGDFVAHINALVQAEVGNVNKRIDSFETSMTSLTQDQKCQKIAEMLSPLGINFLTTDRNADFHTWLNGVDELSNQSRQSLLSQAWNSGDLERASIFYRQFDGSQKVQPQQNPLEQHVQLGQNNAGGGDKAPEVAQWSEAQISAMYRDYSAGRVTQGDFERYEREIFNAASHGRVIQSNFN